MPVLVLYFSYKVLPEQDLPEFPLPISDSAYPFNLSYDKSIANNLCALSLCQAVCGLQLSDAMLVPDSEHFSCCSSSQLPNLPDNLLLLGTSTLVVRCTPLSVMDTLKI